MYHHDGFSNPIRDTWWNRNKGVILGTLVVVATTVAVAEQFTIRDHNKYLKDKGLLDDYYALED